MSTKSYKSLHGGTTRMFGRTFRELYSDQGITPRELSSYVHRELPGLYSDQGITPQELFLYVNRKLPGALFRSSSCIPVRGRHRRHIRCVCGCVCVCVCVCGRHRRHIFCVWETSSSYILCVGDVVVVYFMCGRHRTMQSSPGSSPGSSF